MDKYIKIAMIITGFDSSQHSSKVGSILQKEEDLSIKIISFLSTYFCLQSLS